MKLENVTLHLIVIINEQRLSFCLSPASRSSTDWSPGSVPTPLKTLISGRWVKSCSGINLHLQARNTILQPSADINFTIQIITSYLATKAVRMEPLKSRVGAESLHDAVQRG